MNSAGMKTIGIDARFWGEAGPGRYTKALIEHLEKADTKNKYLIFLRKKGFESYTPQNSNFKKVPAHYKWYSFEEQTTYLIKLLKYKPDLYYVPHFNVPILYPGTLVTAIPDIIMHKFSTNRATTHTSVRFLIKKLAYHLAMFVAVVRSKNIIVPTNVVKKDFLEFYPFLKPEKIVVAPEGIDPDFTVDTSPEFEKKTLEKYGIKKPYLLYVSSMYRHKNVYNLIKAFRILQEKFDFKGQLVLVGKRDYFSEKVGEYVAKKGLEGDVILPGLQEYVGDPEVVALRKNAKLYVFPSLQEGFSLTPLEGMIWNLPAVISDIPCHKEVYGDAVAYFNPLNPEKIAEAINRVLQDEALQKELVKRGLNKIKEYDWQKTADITLEVFEKVLEDRN
ncbi:glycosyltransferase [candidate division WWE3 bacterium]|nr:glycosyltransferase [candidate division WWE3 bacterium]